MQKTSSQEILSTRKYEKIGQREEPWFCLDWEKNLPFLALDTQKFNKLIEIPKKTKISKVYISAGYAARKTTMHSDIKCTHCKDKIHKKCSKVLNAHNYSAQHV